MTVEVGEELHASGRSVGFAVGAVRCFRSDNDIDALIDIHPEARFSLVDLVSVENFLGVRIRRETDAVIREELRPGSHDRIYADELAVSW